MSSNITNINRNEAVRLNLIIYLLNYMQYEKENLLESLLKFTKYSLCRQITCKKQYSESKTKEMSGYIDLEGWHFSQTEKMHCNIILLHDLNSKRQTAYNRFSTLNSVCATYQHQPARKA